MDRLFEPMEFRGVRVRNRICVPPMVCYNWTDGRGLVSDNHIAHYRAIAKGGAGLLIQEATCVSRGGRLNATQLGIWEDGQVEGLRRIVDAVHAEGCPILLQLHHAGAVGIDAPQLGPSAWEGVFHGKEKHAREMTGAEIGRAVGEFAAAARRAARAGYDGVELHGCHSYLLSQFLNRRVNRREDAYGREPARLMLEVYDAVRAAVPANFLVGVRLGGFEPGLADGIAHARLLDARGADFIDVSYGFDGEQELSVPGGPFKEVIAAAAEIKKRVKAPVFAVNGIQTPEQAEAVLLGTGVDMVDIGRGVLVNENWANDARAGRDVGRCLHCATCMWRVDTEKCAGRLLRGRKETGWDS